MKKHYLRTKKKLNKFENYLKDLNIFKPVLNNKGMELIQVMGIMAVAVVLAGVLMAAAQNGFGDQLSTVGKSIASIYDYVEAPEDDGSTEVEVNPADKVSIAYDSQRLGGQLASYYASQEAVTNAQDSADAAQTAADEAKEYAETVEKSGISTYVHSIASSVHTLTGSGENGKFMAISATTVSSFKIGSTTYSVRCGDETSLEMVKDGWYTFVLDNSNNTINFRTGGGLTNSKLAATTATAANVLSGKTFYSGNKTLKTGTMTDKSGTTTSTTASLDTTNKRLRLKVPTNGYYNTNAYLYSSYSNVASTIGLTADKIVKGNTILGVSGTAGVSSNVSLTASFGASTTKTSSTVTLPAGTYTLYYSIASDKGNWVDTGIMPILKLYVGGSVKFTSSGYDITDNPPGTSWECLKKAGTQTVTLSSASSCYLTITSTDTQWNNCVNALLVRTS